MFSQYHAAAACLAQLVEDGSTSILILEANHHIRVQIVDHLSLEYNPFRLDVAVGVDDCEAASRRLQSLRNQADLHPNSTFDSHRRNSAYEAQHLSLDIAPIENRASQNCAPNAARGSKIALPNILVNNPD